MEVEILQRLQMKNIIEYYHHHVIGDRVLIFMELADEDLNQHINMFGSITEPWDIWNIAKQLSAGLYAIHQAGYIHQDMKPKNILVIKKKYFKIADFGCSTKGKQSFSKVSFLPYFIYSNQKI